MSSEDCRICSNEVKAGGVMLFSDKANKALLHIKIRKYLPISVSLDDKLPKMICKDCICKINEFDTFAVMALRNQEKLTAALLATAPPLDPTKNEKESVLKTYLANKESDKKQDSENEETEDTTEEMEVRVDPMSILQCYMDESNSETASDSDEVSLESPKFADESRNDEQYFDDDAEEYQSATTQESGSSESETSENTHIIYLCSICNRNFSTNSALQDHMFVHSTVYAKRVLTLSFNKFQQSLATVFINSQPTTNLTAVPINNSSYPISMHNTNELKSTETSGDIDLSEDSDGRIDGMKCPICAKHIFSDEALKVHLETHRPKGQYGCDICGRVFKTQCNLYRHKEYHQGVQFRCEVCGRVYPTNSTLRAHSITHSDLRPHQCPLCEKTFKRNQDLKFHINQHTGARPYQCPYCPKAFASSGNCFSHRKRMHPFEVERDKERAAKIMR
ncbi:zinc finger protein 596-like [Anthonomus grandis grandis]|uniref:zinc finger protein 596-like n=1 Tax=Anthonomus grandis grandis TaxID=2921223 RepID=UPI0021659521|nr:zinc finger protein 596-like [Anthonomus grandis grandis]